MGGKQTKPVIDPNEVPKLLTRWELRSFEDQFRRLASTSTSTSTSTSPSILSTTSDASQSRIDRQTFIQHALVPLFGSVLTPTIYDRMFQCCDTNGDQYIDWGEWCSWSYLVNYATREEKMKLLFNLYDLTGTGKIGKKEFRKMTQAMMETGDRSQQNVAPMLSNSQAAAAAASSSDGPGKQFGSMFDLLFYFTLFNYDRDNDRALSFQEWRRYAEEDDTINMVISLLQVKSDLGYVSTAGKNTNTKGIMSHSTNQEEEDQQTGMASLTPTTTPASTPSNARTTASSAPAASSTKPAAATSTSTSTFTLKR